MWNKNVGYILSNIHLNWFVLIIMHILGERIGLTTEALSSSLGEKF